MVAFHKARDKESATVERINVYALKYLYKFKYFQKNAFTAIAIATIIHFIT
jgi:hypothetical protein